MNEGYMALTICILRNVTPERAFRILDGDEQWVERRRWTAEDVNEIECLRTQGMTWKQIAKMYNTTKGNIFNVYNYHKKIELSH